MARYTDSVCRQCRRENLKLFLKGDRCYSDKCAFDRRGYPPGQHGERRGRKPSDYGIQLREKQKVKRMYGLSEKQFHLFFDRAEHQKGITGTKFAMPITSVQLKQTSVMFQLWPFIWRKHLCSCLSPETWFNKFNILSVAVSHFVLNHVEWKFL